MWLILISNEENNGIGEFSCLSSTTMFETYDFVVQNRWITISLHRNIYIRSWESILVVILDIAL